MRRTDGNPFSAASAAEALAQRRDRTRRANLRERLRRADVDPEFERRRADGGRRQVARLQSDFQILADILRKVAVVREEFIRDSCAASDFAPQRVRDDLDRLVAIRRRPGCSLRAATRKDGRRSPIASAGYSVVVRLRQSSLVASAGVGLFGCLRRGVAST